MSDYHFTEKELALIKRIVGKKAEDETVSGGGYRRRNRTRKIRK